MARQTRSERRARRTEGEPAVAQRARSRQQQVRPSAQAPKPQTGARRAERDGGSRRFVAECWAELKKVEWPGQSQVIQGTVVVLVACLIVGLYLEAADVAFKHFVQNVLLR